MAEMMGLCWVQIEDVSCGFESNYESNRVIRGIHGALVCATEQLCDSESNTQLIDDWPGHLYRGARSWCM